MSDRGMTRRSWMCATILVTGTWLHGTAGGAPDPGPPVPTAASFVRFLEQNDFWRRASSRGSGAAPRVDLSALQRINPEFAVLAGYHRIHMDYGHRKRERDPMHHVTVLELQFRKEGEVPWQDRQSFQEYPRARSPSQGARDRLVFPLWRYGQLVHHEVEWDHLEYIQWRAFRLDRSVFVVYTIPVAFMDEIPRMADRLSAYLRGEAGRDSLANELRANRDQSLIDFDTVVDLQVLLSRCGFYRGSPDGIWGDSTEGSLSSFLRSLGWSPIETGRSRLKSIASALRRFQSERHLPATGRCDGATIRALKEAWDLRHR